VLLGLCPPLLVTPLELIMKANRDETLEEIWAIRRQIAKQFSGDPQKRVAYYQRKQKASGVRLYQPEIQSAEDLRAVDVLHDHAPAKNAAGQCAMLTSYRAARKRKAKGAK
jgi:hypothetical protein